jgi:hypothetical protein
MKPCVIAKLQDNADQEVERIRLNDYKTDDLHALVQSKGFVRKSDPTPTADEL